MSSISFVNSSGPPLAKNDETRRLIRSHAMRAVHKRTRDGREKRKHILTIREGHPSQLSPNLGDEGESRQHTPSTPDEEPRIWNSVHEQELQERYYAWSNPWAVALVGPGASAAGRKVPAHLPNGMTAMIGNCKKKKKKKDKSREICNMNWNAYDKHRCRFFDIQYSWHSTHSAAQNLLGICCIGGF